MVVRQSLVIEAEEVENRGVKVVDVDDLFHGLMAELVGRPEAEAAFDACAGEPGGESFGVMVAALRAFLKGWHATEFGGPDDERVVEQAAAFQVPISRAAAG